VPLLEIDRRLLERCIERKPGAWEDFVNRFLGLIIHVVNHSVQSRNLTISPEDRDDLCAEFFLRILHNDFAILRRFRGQSSLATYLTVVARRIVVRELVSRFAKGQAVHMDTEGFVDEHKPSQWLEDREEVSRLLEELSEKDAEAVRLFYFEGRSYSEIASAIQVPENSIGPILSRAREKMRHLALQERT